MRVNQYFGLVALPGIAESPNRKEPKRQMKNRRITKQKVDKTPNRM
jgi:hypothetical protein